MIESIAISQSLIGLLDIDPSDSVDWDASALADWPHVALAHAPSSDSTAPSAAAPLAALFDPAC